MPPSDANAKGYVVIEMKYCVSMPTVLRQLVDEFRLSRTSISKYRTSLSALTARTETEAVTAEAPKRRAARATPPFLPVGDLTVA